MNQMRFAIRREADGNSSVVDEVTSPRHGFSLKGLVTSSATAGMDLFAARLKRLVTLTVTLCCLAVSASAAADGDGLFENQIRPLVERYCHDCHSGETTEADLDLGAFATHADVRRQVDVWLKVRTMLDSRQMPPKDSRQPTDDQRNRLQTWVREFLAREAKATAGDPGPVVLRRLNNEEYNYSVRDLTGVALLDPTREFPVDGAAGEGFINTGSAQSMSPALVTKYLDAAKVVASRAALLPDGIAFSAGQSRREWTDERVAAIRRFYSQFTVSSDVQMEVGGTGRVPNEGGAIPLAKYLTATLEEREALTAGRKSVEDVAGERSLNAKYLGILWRSLSADPEQSGGTSLLLDQLRAQWRSAAPNDVKQLVAWISGQQQVLFQYNPIGHIGKDGKSKVWMDIATPLTNRRDFSVRLTEPDSGDVSIFLSASDAGDGPEGDFVVWQNPRLTIENGPDIPLRDLAGLQQSLEKVQTEALARTADYLAAIAEIQAGDESLTEKILAGIAERHNLEASALKSWASYLGIGARETVVVTGHFDKLETHGDYNFIRSWGTGATPIVTANSSDNQVRIPGIARPHGITAHPSPTHFAGIGWQSPIDGLVNVEAQLSDAHPECGDGQEWFLQHRTHQRVGNLWKGKFGVGGSAKMDGQQLSVRKGELISFVLGPGSNYYCDLTEINLTITEVQGKKRTWDLAGDVSNDLLASNPHADRHGNPKVWHFYTGKMSTVDRDQGALVSIPASSRLDHWQMESDAAKRTELARRVQQLATGNPPLDANSPDGILYAQLRTLALSPRSVESLLSDVTADKRFGKHPLGHETASTDLVVQAPSVIEFKIPARLASGRTLVVSGVLHPQAGRDGTVRLEAGLNRVEPSAIGVANPIVAGDGSQARARVLKSFAEFRDLFPPHLCYERIVPVDEVVTLTLFYRQDNALQRLMLDDKQTAELNRMWDELFYVAQEPLRYAVGFEQIREFATQDRPDLVKVWDPLKPQVLARADAFRKRLLDTEPAHLAAVLEFAGRAWRRPLTGDQRAGLSQFYRNLRTAEMSHEDAIRLTLARVLTSPAFLYRREVQSDGSQPQPVTDLELASRLSFFLWSSVPDAELRRVAESGGLSDGTALAEQTRRMLKGPRTRRLAIQFACQWLHLRGFDQDDNKNEKLYPEFASLRGEMYEETVRFFEDLFRSDGSILDVLGANHTFLNEALAKHYGIGGVEGPQWRRVDSVRSHARGGILGMASLLASQSGASRTSPILRGNFATGWFSSKGCTTPRRSKATFTVRRPAIFCPALHSRPAGRFGPGPASIRSLPSESVSRRSCQVLCSVAKRQTRRCIKITRCSTARIFPGAARRHRLRWKCIRPWRLTSCSRTRLKRATKACSMRFWLMRGTFVAASADSISKNWMSI
ncbi:MAG: DUF1592 domain-containing protein [Phycisphaera sp. RhM]|nr:DUF1592 domain-containing protein [Phycisphaera sp. RhM]